MVVMLKATACSPVWEEQAADMIKLRRRCSLADDLHLFRIPEDGCILVIAVVA
jgi:hypothetical protein